MQKFRITVCLTAIVAVVMAAVPASFSIDPTVSIADAATNGPAFQTAVQDNGCSNQYQQSGLIYPDLSGGVTDTNGKDPDCFRLMLSPGSISPSDPSIYTRDFRIGVSLGESENGCTRDMGPVRYSPWMSEGGGATGWAYGGGNIQDPDCLWIWYQTRDLPSNLRIKDVRLGGQTGGSAVRWTPWATQGGGWSSFTNGGNMKSVQMYADVQLDYSYNAQYVSDTIPDALNNGQSGDYAIRVKNTDTTWTSNVYKPDECENPAQQPNGAGIRCPASGSAVSIYSSERIQLKQLSQISGITITPTSEISQIPGSSGGSINIPAGNLAYRNPVSRVYSSYDMCPATAFTKPHSLWAQLTKFIKIKQAEAVPPFDPDLPEDPPIPCDPTFRYLAESQTPANVNILNTNEVDFPARVTVSNSIAPGLYTINFQMIKTYDGETFGQQFPIQIQVGPAAPTFALELSPASRSVDQGGSTTFMVVAQCANFGGPITSLTALTSPSVTGATFSFKKNGAVVSQMGCGIDNSVLLEVSNTNSATPVNSNIAITVRGTASGIGDKTSNPATLRINGDPVRLLLMPASLTAIRGAGSGVDYSVTAVCDAVYTGPVRNLTVNVATDTPVSGVTFTFRRSGQDVSAPATIACGETLALRAVAAGNASPINLARKLTVSGDQ